MWHGNNRTYLVSGSNQCLQLCYLEMRGLRGSRFMRRHEIGGKERLGYPVLSSFSLLDNDRNCKACLPFFATAPLQSTMCVCPFRIVVLHVYRSFIEIERSRRMLLFYSRMIIVLRLKEKKYLSRGVFLPIPLRFDDIVPRRKYAFVRHRFRSCALRYAKLSNGKTIFNKTTKYFFSYSF